MSKAFFYSYNDRQIDMKWCQFIKFTVSVFIAHVKVDMDMSNSS